VREETAERVIIVKVCILSMQRVSNFGSLLQGYALKKMLEQQGHTVSFLDIEPNPEDNRLLYGSDDRIPRETALYAFFRKLKNVDKYVLNRIRIKSLAKQQDVKFQEFRQKVLEISENNGCLGNYDCCVIGSDEVFNCLQRAPWGFTSQLFGNVPQASRVITYAASCGATVYKDVPEMVAQRIKDTFENVAAFSVRDRNTQEFVAKMTEKTVLEHLDPALVFDFRDEISAAKLPEHLPERYCVIYSYYNRFCDPKDIDRIKRFCKKKNMKIVSVGAPQMWIKDHLVLTPFEALKVFENAAFVITDTFHGTIFASKYARRFAVMTRSSNMNKLCDLVERLNLRKHLVASMDELENAFMQENDCCTMAVLAKQERSRTEEYLVHNI